MYVVEERLATPDCELNALTSRPRCLLHSTELIDQFS